MGHNRSAILPRNTLLLNRPRGYPVELDVPGGAQTETKLPPIHPARRPRWMGGGSSRNSIVAASTLVLID